MEVACRYRLMAGGKWYVVWAGHEAGVYDSWAECKRQIEGYKGAQYKSFLTRSEAMRAYEEGYASFRKKHYSEPVSQYPILEALSVDAACSGNPGVMEYRGVMVDNRQEVFRVGPFSKGTNNIGEFLAIVHGLSLLKKHGCTFPLYTDSVTALGWVRKKKCKTLLPLNEETKPLFDLIARAEAWLCSNTYETPLLKWDTLNWGEIPADFGRKG